MFGYFLARVNALDKESAIERNFSSLGIAIDKERTEDYHSQRPQRRSGDDAPALCTMEAERALSSPWELFRWEQRPVFVV